MSPLLPFPIQDGADLTDAEAAELQPTRKDLLAWAVEDARIHARLRWEPTEVANAIRTNAVEDGERWVYLTPGDVDFDDFLRARSDREPERQRDAASWLALQDAEVVQLVEDVDEAARRLEVVEAEERADRWRAEAEQRSRDKSIRVRANSIGRGHVGASEIEGGGDQDSPLWDGPTVIMRDLVPYLGGDGLWHEPYHEEVVALAFLETSLALVTGTWLTVADLSAMVEVGLKPADEATVARTLRTTRLDAARIMSRFDRPMYVYDHAYWTGDSDLPRRSTSRSRKPRRATVADEIAAVLGADQMTVTEIAIATRKSEPSVLLALKRGPFAKSGERPARWRLAVEESQAP